MDSKMSRDIPSDTIVLKLTREPWKLECGGSVKDVELAIAMLNQALNFFNLQRFFIAVEEQQKAMSAVASILDGQGRRM